MASITNKIIENIPIKLALTIIGIIAATLAVYFSDHTNYNTKITQNSSHIEVVDAKVTNLEKEVADIKTQLSIVKEMDSKLDKILMSIK